VFFYLVLNVSYFSGALAGGFNPSPLVKQIYLI